MKTATAAPISPTPYVDEVRASMRGLALTEASQRRLFYEAQLNRVKEDLAQAEVSFKQVQQGSRMISVDSQARTLIEGAASLRAQIAAREVELERLRSYATNVNPQVQIAETEVRALRAQLAGSKRVAKEDSAGPDSAAFPMPRSTLSGPHENSSTRRGSTI